jgi:hypothetical protein
LGEYPFSPCGFATGILSTELFSLLGSVLFAHGPVLSEPVSIDW